MWNWKKNKKRKTFQNRKKIKILSKKRIRTKMIKKRILLEENKVINYLKNMKCNFLKAVILTLIISQILLK